MIATTPEKPVLAPKDKAAAAGKPSSRYLPGLNGIRALASLIIIAAHVDEFSYLFGKHEIGFNNTRFCIHAVTAFFVLSGFLITYLLLLEKQKYNRIQFGKFYTRRILRLWPVYFLLLCATVVLVFVSGILPETKQNLSSLIYYVLFIPNVPFALGGMFSIITPLWSIGVDEQFYAFWPFLVNKSKNIARTLIVFIVVYFLLKVGFQFYKPLANVSLVMAVSRLDCMAIGGLGAYLIIEKPRILTLVYSKWVQLACWLVCLYSVCYQCIHIFTLIDYEMYALVFIIIIVNVSTNPKSLLKLENKVFNLLGRISYGTQLYHLMIVYLLAHFIGRYIDGLGEAPHFFVLYGLTLAISIPLAYLSYNYFELPFINLKKKFTRVASTNDNEEEKKTNDVHAKAMPVAATVAIA